MRIDPNANVEAFAKLADKSGEVQTQVGIGVMKQALETAESAFRKLVYEDLFFAPPAARRAEFDALV